VITLNREDTDEAEWQVHVSKVGQHAWLRKPSDKPEEWLEDMMADFEELKAKNEWHTTAERISVVQGVKGASSEFSQRYC
jgi:hypothetical protein